jgi:hypothetical protein
MTDPCCDVPAPTERLVYFPDELIIYGTKLNHKDPEADDGGFIYAGVGQELQVRLVKPTPLKNKKYSIILGYGYAYEGHCYRFDRIRIFVTTEKQDPAVGCGFGDGYSMWRIRAAAELLELTTNVSDAQTLILDANLPGKKSPTTYNANMGLAHRGGRLTQD